jgi:hypothetical protein
MWPSRGLPHGTMALVVCSKFMDFVGFEPWTSPIVQSLGKSALLMRRTVFLNKHMYLNLFKLKLLYFWRGGRAGA